RETNRAVPARRGEYFADRTGSRSACLTRKRTVPIPPEAVLFDMDGTLIDSEPIWFDTEISILADYGYLLGQEHVVNVLGKPNEIAVQYLLDVSGVPLTPEQLNQRIEEAMVERLGAGIELVPGAKELFTELDAAGIPAALVTASSRRIVEA